MLGLTRAAYLAQHRALALQAALFGEAGFAVESVEPHLVSVVVAARAA